MLFAVCSPTGAQTKVSAFKTNCSTINGGDCMEWLKSGLGELSLNEKPPVVPCQLSAPPGSVTVVEIVREGIKATSSKKRFQKVTAWRKKVHHPVMCGVYDSYNLLITHQENVHKFTWVYHMRGLQIIVYRPFLVSTHCDVLLLLQGNMTRHVYGSCHIQTEFLVDTGTLIAVGFDPHRIGNPSIAFKVTYCPDVRHGFPMLKFERQAYSDEEIIGSEEYSD